MSVDFSVPNAAASALCPTPSFDLVIKVNPQTQVVYVFDLLGAGGARTRLPISSFQLRHSEGNKPWLAAYSPGGIETYAAVASMPDLAFLAVGKGYRYADGSASSYAEIARVAPGVPRIAQGARNATVTFQGYGAEAPNANPRYVNLIGTQTLDYDEDGARVRASSESVVRPGDYVQILALAPGQWLRVSAVEYVVTTDLQYVDITIVVS